MQGLVPPDRCTRNPVQRKAPGGEGLYAAPFLGMETRHVFGAAGRILPATALRHLQHLQHVSNMHAAPQRERPSFRIGPRFRKPRRSIHRHNGRI